MDASGVAMIADLEARMIAEERRHREVLVALAEKYPNYRKHVACGRQSQTGVNVAHGFDRSPGRLAAAGKAGRDDEKPSQC